MDRFRISPRPRNTGRTLASDVLAFPLWYLTVEHSNQGPPRWRIIGRHNRERLLAILNTDKKNA